MTSTTANNGRLGNQIIRNLAVSFIASKHDLYVDYCSMNLISEQLGIFLHNGKHVYNDAVILNDDNFFTILNASSFLHNLDPNRSYFQTREISQLIHSYLHRDDIKNNILTKNPYQNRYSKNNDLFIHVRLDDAAQWNPGIQYYLSAISKINFDKIYISSDDVNHDLIHQIIHKYPNSTIITYDEINTIQFASTCKNIILSHGSFSATIGNLAFFSNIFYPKFVEENKRWCGDMFSIDGWTKIEDF